jgi:hypothetical protein
MLMDQLKKSGLLALLALAFSSALLFFRTHPDGPLEQALEALLRDAAHRGGQALGVHIDMHIDLSPPD